MADQAFVSIQGLTKRFGGVVALDQLTLDLQAGEIHAICGENGAGKSTLNRLLAGSLAPDAGSILVDGQPMEGHQVSQAEERGIVMVHQEPMLFPHLDAADNIHLMHEPGKVWLDRATMRSRSAALLASLGEQIAVDVPLEELSHAQRQMVAIARALARNCRLLILDEPTASLSQRESAALFQSIRRLKADGVTVLYVSHRLEEVFMLADRVSVLRDGHLVQTLPVASCSRDQLIQLMVGREVQFPTKAAGQPAEIRLKVSGLTEPGLLQSISFEVRSGEVLALAGLVGAGRSEVAQAIFGLLPRREGEVEVLGQKLRAGDPVASLQAGLAYVPEDRQREGLHLPMSVRENLAMAHLRSISSAGWIHRREEQELSGKWIRSLAIRTPSGEGTASSLSGGNQQKVLLGKWLETRPKVLILDEPTRGIDVGAKAEVHRLIGELAADGMAIVLISSELPEVVALADRVIVLRQAEIAGELAAGEISQERILPLALPKEEVGRVDVAAKRKQIPREAGLLALLALTMLVATIVNPAFLTVGNMKDMLVKAAPAMIAASGLTLVILAREIDISIGSLMGLCSAILGLAGSTDKWGWPPLAAGAACVSAGLLGGLINGWMVSRWRIPSIIVTLATLSIFRGATELLMGGVWIKGLPDGLREAGTGGLLGVPWIVLAAIAIAGAGIAASRQTPFGRRLVALGSHPLAADRIGLPAPKLRMGAFAVSGACAGVATLLSATQLQVIESGFGAGFELLAVSAVVVGGTSIRGGKGSVLGSVIAAGLLTMVGTVLIFLKLGQAAVYWERAVQGLFILGAVLADPAVLRREARS